MASLLSEEFVEDVVAQGDGGVRIAELAEKECLAAHVEVGGETFDGIDTLTGDCFRVAGCVNGRGDRIGMVLLESLQLPGRFGFALRDRI